MEIVLQWLDELDDLVFTLAFFWQGSCRIGLIPGVAAAAVLTPIFGIDLTQQYVIVLTFIAAGSVLAWLTAAALTMRGSLRDATAA